MTNPVDAFADINIDDFKKDLKEEKQESYDVDIEAIKKVAEKNNFPSRQKPAKKEKTLTRSVSLFGSEDQIIQNTIADFYKSQYASEFRPSASDVIRAALHIFSRQEKKSKLKTLIEVRGRGRK